MKNIKRIVVGLDIFAKSNNVLKRALLIADRTKAELFVIHVVHTPWLSLPSYFGSEDIEIDTKGIINTIDTQIKKLSKDMDVHHTVFVKQGNTSDIIEYESKLLKADLVIMGVNTGGKKTFLGSTVEKVAHQCHLPVLIVKNPVKGVYKHIVAPTDFLEQSKESIAFAQKNFSKAKIKPVHSLEEVFIDGPYLEVGYDFDAYNKAAKEYAKSAMKGLVEEYSIQKGRLLDGATNNKKALLSYIKRGDYDLTLLGSQGTAGVNAFLGSMALYILRETPTDVLVYEP